jgi:D-alanyl-D-alanine carboxypeptidase (penicillin-binding protein 5/6)
LKAGARKAGRRSIEAPFSLRTICHDKMGVMLRRGPKEVPAKLRKRKAGKTMIKKLTALFTTLILLCATGLPAYAEVDPELGFEVNSQAVYLVNNESGIVIYQKNAQERMYPASLTKIVTAIVAIENCQDLENTMVTAPSYIFDELYTQNVSHADIRHGETLSMLDLLYAMMLRSACEAASIVADYIGNGSIETFVQMMNDTAKRIGVSENTHFVNPHGLHNDEQYTTAEDMYLITKYAMNIPIFAQIATTNKYTMAATNKHSEARTIYHTNTMMDENRGGSFYYPYIAGIKTGTTDQSGRNLVSTATKDAYSYTLVTMKAPMYYDNGDTISDNLAYVDAKQLYNWAFDKWAVRNVVKTSTVKGQVPVELCSEKDVISVFPETDVDRLLRKDIDLSALQEIKTLDETVDAPVEAGQVLGTLEVKLNDETIAKVNLVAGETLERSEWLFFLRKLKGVFTSVWFKLAVAFVLLLVALYILYAIMYNRRKRRRRRTTKRF